MEAHLMDFALPIPPEDADPSDDWKKKNGDDDLSKLTPIDPNFKCELNKDAPFEPNTVEIPHQITKWNFGQPPLPFALAHALSLRFTEIGFDPDTIKDIQTFGFLFIAQENCLMITRKAAEKEPTYYISAHRFLERKKK